MFPLLQQFQSDDEEKNPLWWWSLTQDSECIINTKFFFMTQMMNRWICQSVNKDRHNKYINVYKMAWPKKCTSSQTVITVAETLHSAKPHLLKRNYKVLSIIYNLHIKIIENRKILYTHTHTHIYRS
jgi:hypothetical protein